jgi:hypothetical protein
MAENDSNFSIRHSKSRTRRSSARAASFILHPLPCRLRPYSWPFYPTGHDRRPSRAGPSFLLALVGLTFEDFPAMVVEKLRMRPKVSPLGNDQAGIAAKKTGDRIRNPIFRQKQGVIIID